MPTVLRGIAASPGIAIAPLFILARSHAGKLPAPPKGDPRSELERYSAAVAAARGELLALRDGTARELGPEKAEIFDAHLSILADPELSAAVKSGILEAGLGARAALDAAAQTFIDLLSALEDELFAARIDDIRDLARRLAGHLDGKGGNPWAGLGTESVVAAEDLSPSETRLMDPAMVKGFATATGSAASHSSILARSMRIPAVVGIGTGLSFLAPGNLAVIDGDEGLVILDPDPGQLADYRVRLASRDEKRRRDLAFVDLPSLSKDGTAFELAANVGGIADIRVALDCGADGIGLFRTEFMYMDRPSLPSEEEQYQVYRHAVEMMAPRPVLIRTLDVGGDKELACLPLPREDNPFLGVRALRLCLARPEIFRPQLRALLRASAHGRLRIMFPMVAVADELRQARALLAEERDRLRSEGHILPDRVETGIMIEIPAAALMADRLAGEVDFFSVGSNDLTQYAMAADRMNPRVAKLHDSLHPALLRLIGPVATAAARAGIWAGICGEMAADPLALPLLAGAGFRELSMSPRAVPGLRACLAGLDLRDARKLYETARDLDSAEDVRDLVGRSLGLPRTASKKETT